MEAKMASNNLLGKIWLILIFFSQRTKMIQNSVGVQIESKTRNAPPHIAAAGLLGPDLVIFSTTDGNIGTNSGQDIGTEWSRL